MYLTIDVGGTKTLVAVFSTTGELIESVKYPTPADYPVFIESLAHTVADLSTKDFELCVCAMPGIIDETGRTVISFGNLNWKNVHVADDIEKRIVKCKVYVENDAKLAALSEAINLKNKFAKVLYITISTGIGVALVSNGVIDRNIGDRGGNALMIEHEGSVVSWESFASGKAILKRYGKIAKDIDDPKVWDVIAGDLSLGIVDLIALTLPDVVVIGGGVGSHFDKFEAPLKAKLQAFETPMLPIPPIVRAKNPEEAVIYGAYEQAKQIAADTGTN